MKIDNVECFIVGNPPPYFGGRYFIFIKVSANNIIGWGECYAPPFHPESVKVMIKDISERFVNDLSASSTDCLTFLAP